MRRAPYFIVLLSALILQSCQEEGCTDPQALNFDATADEDDGSCLYCTEPESSTTISLRDSLTENRFGSSLFGENVFELYVEQTEITEIIRPCPDQELFCTIEVAIRNITEFEMANFQMEISISGPQVFQSYFVQDVNLESGMDTIISFSQADLNFSSCPRFENSSVQHNIFSGIYLE